MLPILTAGVVVAFLYFARDVVVPVTLAVLLSFLLAPAVRGLRRLGMGRVAAVSFTVLVWSTVMLAGANVIFDTARSREPGVTVMVGSVEVTALRGRESVQR